MTQAQRDAWAKRHTDRNAVVAYDRSERTDRQPLIAEELVPRALAKLSPKARRVAGQMLRMDAKTRAEVFAAFAADGTLKLPFEFVAPKVLPHEHAARLLPAAVITSAASPRR
jgi:hypothetical protein